MLTPDTRSQFNQISALLKNNEKAQAIALLKPILAKEPGNAQAWWLAAHAAPTPEAAVQACERVLKLKPDYQPARQMITDFKLKQAAALLKEAQSSEALLLIRPVVAEQPDNVEALWLLARAVPVAKEAIETCLHILALQPDHEGAKRLIATKQQNLAAAQALRQSRRPQSRSRAWMVFGLLGIMVLLGASLLVALYLKGVGLPKIVTHNLGRITDTTSLHSPGDRGILGSDTSGLHVYTDSLPPDGQRDYTFDASANSFFLGMVIFPTAGGNPGRAVTLIGPDGNLVASGNAQDVGQKGMAFVQAVLPSDGNYTLRLKGIPNVAQGAYTVQMGVQAGEGMQ